eukprot:6390289-Amphidinium_carterae.1
MLFKCEVFQAHVQTLAQVSELAAGLGQTVVPDNRMGGPSMEGKVLLVASACILMRQQNSIQLSKRYAPQRNGAHWCIMSLQDGKMLTKWHLGLPQHTLLRRPQLKRPELEQAQQQLQSAGSYQQRS